MYIVNIECMAEISRYVSAVKKVKRVKGCIIVTQNQLNYDSSSPSEPLEIRHIFLKKTTTRRSLLMGS